MRNDQSDLCQVPSNLWSDYGQLLDHCVDRIIAHSSVK